MGDTFNQWSGLFEGLRFLTIISGCFAQLWKVSKSVDFIDPGLAQPLRIQDVLRSVMGAIFAFAGFESCAQFANSPWELGVVIGSTVALASLTYMLTAHAAYRLMGDLSSVDKSVIIPTLASEAWRELGGQEFGIGATYGVAFVVQTLTMLNGTVGCIRYSTNLMGDAAVERHLGPMSSWFVPSTSKAPAAILVLMISVAFWSSGQHMHMLDTFSTMNTVTHSYCGFTLMRLSRSRASHFDTRLAVVCLSATTLVFIAVLTLEETVGSFTIAVVAACIATTYL